jgi:Tfp pilus assembly protein PilF
MEYAMNRTRLAVCLTVFAALLLGTAFAQSGSSGASSGGSKPTGGSTTSTSTGSRGTTSTSPQQQQRQPERPIFLRGQVVIDDGTKPSGHVAIERVCNGVVHREAYADQSGSFSFQVGANTGIFQDASVSSMNMPGLGGLSGNPGSGGTPGMLGSSTGVNPRELMGCEIRASLAGYRSDSIMLTSRQAFDDPEIGTIVLHRMGKVEGSTISVTSLKAPKDAHKALEHGRKAAKNKEWPAAQAEFEKAVQLYPQYAEAWWELGVAQQAQNNAEEARASYEKAIAADSRFMSPYFQLAQLAAAKSDWKGMAELTDRVLALDAYDYPAMYFFNAVANYNLGKIDVAEKSARSAKRLDSQHRIPRIEFLLANILAARRDYPAAAEEMRSYLKFVPDGPDAAQAKMQLAELEKRVTPSATSEAPK